MPAEIQAKTQDNFRPTKSNITPLKSEKTSSTTTQKYYNGIMELTKNTEDFTMSQETYSKEEIDLKFDKISSDVQNGFDKVNLKFDSLEQRMDDRFKQVDLKFDNFEHRIENMLLTQEYKRLEDQAENKKEFMYWFIGLLISSVIGIVAIIVTILTTK